MAAACWWGGHRLLFCLIYDGSFMIPGYCPSDITLVFYGKAKQILTPIIAKIKIIMLVEQKCPFLKSLIILQSPDSVLLLAFFFHCCLSLSSHRSFSLSCWLHYLRSLNLPAQWAPCWRWCLAACRFSPCWWRTSHSRWSGSSACCPPVPSQSGLHR